MAEYIGLKQIAERLKCCIPTVRRMHAEEGLLLFRQRLARVRSGARGWAWCTSDELIALWQVGRCKADRAFLPPGLQRRAANRPDAGSRRGR